MDHQQDRVYKWEGTWPLWTRQGMSKAKCKDLVRKVSGLYRIPPPSLKFPDKRSVWAYYKTPNHYISLPRHARNASTVLHEMAHAIHWYILGESSHEDHGPEWLGIFLWLLCYFGVASEEAIIATAQLHRLRWRSTAYIGPKAIRKKYKRLARLAKLQR